MKRIVLVVVMSMAVLYLTVPVLAEDYEIRLHRPRKAGQTYRLNVSGSDHSQMSMDINSKPEKRDTEDMTIDFESIVTILEVGKKGNPVKESHRIVRCNRAENGARIALVPTGSILVASKVNEKYQFTLEGKEPSPEAKEAFEMAISLDDSDSTEDDAFGTKARKKIGDSWPINAEVAAAELSSSELGFKKENFSGNVTLAGIGIKDTIPCLMISGVVMVNQFDFPISPEIYTDRSQGSFTFTSKYPLDLAMGVLEEITNFSIDVVLKNKPDKDAPDITMHVYKERAMTRQFKY
jgi:hypothetical protein